MHCGLPVAHDGLIVGVASLPVGVGRSARMLHQLVVVDAVVLSVMCECFSSPWDTRVRLSASGSAPRTLRGSPSTRGVNHIRG